MGPGADVALSKASSARKMDSYRENLEGVIVDRSSASSSSKVQRAVEHSRECWHLPPLEEPAASSRGPRFWTGEDIGWPLTRFITGVGNIMPSLDNSSGLSLTSLTFSPWPFLDSARRPAALDVFREYLYRALFRWGSECPTERDRLLRCSFVLSVALGCVASSPGPKVFCHPTSFLSAAICVSSGRSSRWHRVAVHCWLGQFATVRFLEAHLSIANDKYRWLENDAIAA